MRVIRVCMCTCVVTAQWEVDKSVSDSITDLPPCSPLIFDGAGQWRGSHSGTVGFKLK